MSFNETTHLIQTRFSEFLEKLKDKYNYTEQELENIVKNIDITGKNKLRGKDVNLCECTIKSGSRKGQKCGSKTKDGEKYCTRHIKQQSLDEKQNEEENKLDYEYTARLNRHGKYEFGKTGLIFKSQTEIYIIGKQLDNGTIVKLSDEDKELCKKHKLRYVKS